MLTGMFGWRMTFNFFRLVVLLTTPALRRAGAGAAMAPLLAALLALMLLLPAGAAQAAEDQFNGGNVAGCTLASATYTCATLSQANDITVASGYTVEVSGSVAFTWFQVLKLSGSAVLRAGADLDLRGLQTGNTQVAGGTLAAGGAFRLGSNDQTVTANVVAASVATGGPSTRINGSVTTTGLVDLGSNSTITGAVKAGSLKTNSNITLGGSVTASGAVDLGSNTTITGTLSAATVTANSNVQVNGGITASGTVSLGSNNIVKGGITGITGTNNGIAGAVTTGAGSTITGDIVASAFTLASGSSLTGNITAPQVELSAANVVVKGSITASTSLVVGSGGSVTGNIDSPKVDLNAAGVTIKGDIKASTSLNVGSGGSVTGNIDSPKVDLNASGVTIKGDIKATTSLTIGSGNAVNGNIVGTTLTIASSNVIVNGNVTMTGDVDIGSGATINGDLAARNVTTHSSGDNINGNAAVNAIFLDWGAKVGKTITCTGPGAVGCSCVTKADPNYFPTCGAPPASQVHHIQISHGGSALTCQPEPVTLTACANATCTAPHYNGATQVTLQPGGGVFTISGGTNNTASVRQSTAGTATLSASGGANASTCANSAAGMAACEMAFSDSGLSISVPDHVAMTNASVTVQALKSTNNGKSCVPLVANQTVSVNFSCTYTNPTPAKAADVPLWLRDNKAATAVKVACGGAGAGVQLAFDANGDATANLQYAEVGTVTLKAAYSAGGVGASSPDSVAFTAAPAGFTLTAQRVPPTPALAAGVFAKASEPFTLIVKAVNKNGDVTTNFSKELTPENIKIEPVIIEPVVIAPATAAGKLSTATQPFLNGVATNTHTFDETGTVKLTARLDRLSGNYMDNSTSGFKTIGEAENKRFIPDHFDTVLMTDDEIKALTASRPDARVMSCAGLPDARRPCPGLSGSFIHSKQPFFVKVLAYNGASPPALTKNYTGTSAKPITLSAITVNAAGAVVVPLAAPAKLDWTAVPIVPVVPAIPAVPATQRFSFTEGVGVPAANLPLIDLGGAYPAAVAPITVYLRAEDDDKATSDRGKGPVSVEAQLTAVSGRLLLANTYGPPTGTVPMNASAEYYMPGPPGYYVFNPQVQITSAPINSSIVFNACAKGLTADHCNAMKAAASPAPLVLKNGKGVFRLPAPTPPPTSIGSVDVSLDALINYLPSAFGRATFGIYRSGPVIYRREVY